jgi:4-hydroxybenzoate polyprenyltransferase
MRKLFVISSVVFAVLGIVFTVLPMGTIAFLPIGIAFILSLLANYQSKTNQKRLPKIILVIAALTFLVVIGKVVFVKDVVVSDKQFEQNKVESKKEDIKDLEGL